MRPCEAILRIGRAKIKENNGGGEFKYETFDTYKNFYKCHNVPPPSTTIKNKISISEATPSPHFEAMKI
jgi:hypothetical protein